MIKLQEHSEKKDNRIVFEPRPGFGRGRGSAPKLDFPLIYGHRCNYCNNVIQALFKAPREFSLWPYEETKLLSQGEKNAGEVRTIYPDDKTKYGKSCYRVDSNDAEGGSIKITLKNHIVRNSALVERKFNGEGLWEVGERPCTRIGIFSLREDLLIKDWLLFSQMDEAERSKYNLPSIKELIPESNTNFSLINAIGTAPPVILVERTSLTYGFHYQIKPLITPFRNK